MTLRRGDPSLLLGLLLAGLPKVFNIYVWLVFLFVLLLPTRGYRFFDLGKFFH